MADMQPLRDQIRDWSERVTADALERTYQETVRAAPERTGALKQLISVTPPVDTGGGVWFASIQCGAMYAGFTDAGTAPHLIVARPGGVLAFFWEKVGRDVFFRFVNHPGSRGTQWFNGGEDDGDPMASRWLENTASAAAAA